MSVADVGPCELVTSYMPVLNAVLNALQLALVTWLVQRRKAADVREQNGNATKLDQRSIDAGPSR